MDDEVSVVVVVGIVVGVVVGSVVDEPSLGTNSGVGLDDVPKPLLFRAFTFAV